MKTEEAIEPFKVLIRTILRNRPIARPYRSWLAVLLVTQIMNLEPFLFEPEIYQNRELFNTALDIAPIGVWVFWTSVSIFCLVITLWQPRQGNWLVAHFFVFTVNLFWWAAVISENWVHGLNQISWAALSTWIVYLYAVFWVALLIHPKPVVEEGVQIYEHRPG